MGALRYEKAPCRVTYHRLKIDRSVNERLIYLYPAEINTLDKLHNINDQNNA